MELFHALNRGVEKRDIFLDDQDRQRFVTGLDLFNDQVPVDNLRQIINGERVRPTRSNKKPYVKIHGWCLMRNHYHLLLSEVTSGGITRFLMKLNVGYAKYFNERYKRSGTLFQGRTKKVPIIRDAHFLYILHYIHLNPLDHNRNTHRWREGNLTRSQEALDYLRKYRWSSYGDYCGTPNFPDIVTTSFFNEIFEDYQKNLQKYIKEMEIETIRPLLLE